MLLQYTITAVIIAVASLYLGKRAIRVWRGNCSSNCGCKPDDNKNKDSVVVDTLTILKR